MFSKFLSYKEKGKNEGVFLIVFFLKIFIFCAFFQILELYVCSGKNLTKLPNLPEYTKEVDLSENQIKDDAFDELDIKKYHYDNVQSLSISGNHLENLSVKLLKMKLNIKLSAKNNQLSSVSNFYFFFFYINKIFLEHLFSLYFSRFPMICHNTS